jgi:nucleoside-diphosphate-sugar epimerase
MQAASSTISGARLSARPFGASGRQHSSAARRAQVLVRADSVLIANTKGGGHAFLGLHLAKKLLNEGHSVTILNDGDPAKLTAKAPFSQYASLPGLNVVWGNPADPAAIPSGWFDVVYDNNGKDMEACQPLIDHFKGKVKHYVFVGSAGAYEANSVEPMHVEGDKRKASAGHVAVEEYLVRQDLPYTVFQPLYIYGPHTAKDCEQWFMDRVLRDRPVPIPGPGIQLTSLSNVEDLADMMARVPGNPGAVQQHFNLCSDRCITFDGIVKAVAAAAGKEAKIVHYDPKAVKLGKGEGFPFRAVHFFASADKAKRVLGWQPHHNFLKDVNQLVRDYIASGRLDKDIDFSVDDKILAAVGK